VVDSSRGFSHGMKIALARIVPKNIPKGFWSVGIGFANARSMPARKSAGAVHI